MQYNLKRLVFCIALILFSTTCSAVGAEAEKKVAILSFDAAEAGKYQVLKDGLRSMIAGRLAAEDDITLVAAELGEAERKKLTGGQNGNIQPLFKKLGVQYIGAGRMMLMDNTLKLQMSFYREDGNLPIEVGVEAEGDQQILPAVDLLVVKIVDEVLGLREGVPQASPAVGARKGMEGFQTEHPDRKFKEEIISGSALTSEEGGVVIARSDMVRRKSELRDGIISMDAADMDGDDVEEIFIVSRNKLKVFNYTRGLLEQIGQYEFPASLEVHAINLADLNNDGKLSIYLSAVAYNHFSSLIMSWSVGKGFQLERDKIRFAIRPLQLPDGKWVLLGQERTIRGENFLRQGIFELRMDAGKDKIVKGKRMFLPESVNLFDFTIADLDNDGSPEKIVLNSDLKMVVYDSGNNLLWQSTADYGGNVTYLGRRWQEQNYNASGLEDVAKDGEFYAELYYIPVRLLAKDTDGDGDVEIITAKNALSSFRFMKNLRSFKTGQVACLDWTGTGMKEIWTTDTLDGHVAEIYFSVKNTALNVQLSKNTRNVRMLVGQVSGGGVENILPFSESSDNLLSYEFTVSPETAEIPGDKQ